MISGLCALGQVRDTSTDESHHEIDRRAIACFDHALAGCEKKHALFEGYGLQAVYNYCLTSPALAA
jgi:hypothetical protein